MPNFSAGNSETEPRQNDAESQPNRPGPQRRGGHRSRITRGDGSAAFYATREPSGAIAPADEAAVSRQLRLLTSPLLIKAKKNA